jgi:gluconate 2-dehydrogenase gamma chain
MDDQTKVSRREFIKLATLGAGTLTVVASAVSLLESCSTSPPVAGNFLTDEEYRLVEALAEQIIPSDQWPGGRDAGVANFIDLQLAGPYRRFQNDYRTGLAAITDSCLKKHRQNFEKLPWETQTAFLLDMEAGKVEGEHWTPGLASRFFELIRSHSMQGYYGSPRHGGNKDFVSYRMMDLDPVQTVGQNRYRT